jgi:hypothetical protein
MFSLLNNSSATTVSQFVFSTRIISVDSTRIISTDTFWSNNVGPYGSDRVEVRRKPTKAELSRLAMRAHLSSVRPAEVRARPPNHHSGPVSPDFCWMTHRFSSYRRKSPSKVRRTSSR